MSQHDPIVAETLNAISALAGTRVPSVTERSAAPAVDGHGAVSVSRKGSGYLGVDDQPAGSTLNPQAQLGLFHKIRRKGDWARFVSFIPTDESSGYLDVWSDENFRMHPTASEGPRRNIPLHKPDLSNLTFQTHLVSGAVGIRLKAVRAAAKAGQDVNALIRDGVAAGIANVLMDIGVNGDDDLPADTDDNKMLRLCDGWFQKIRANGTFVSQADGFSYHNGIWPGVLQQIDAMYRADKGLAWGLPDVLSTRWLTELTRATNGGDPSIVNDFGSALLNAMGGQANPLGKPGIVIPQIATTGYGTEGYSGLAPSSVVDDGDGTMTINVNTLADSGVDRSSTGDDGQRYVTIGCTATGVEETLAVDFSTPNNTVSTATLLGQVGTPSTTAGDYYVKWADLTSLYLGVMRYLLCVVQNGIRIYTVFYPHDEVIEVIIHMDLDYVVADYDAMCLVDDIIAPRFSVTP